MTRTVTLHRRALIAALAAAGMAASAAAADIKIGAAEALSGPAGQYGQSIKNGFQLAVDEINAAGGVKGRKLEIVMRDTQGDPTKAVNATQELISQAKVHAIWGPVNSGEALATTPISIVRKSPIRDTR